MNRADFCLGAADARADARPLAGNAGERAPLGSSAPRGPRHSGALPFLTVATALWPDPASCAYKEAEGDPRASAGPEPPADRQPGPWARVTGDRARGACDRRPGPWARVTVAAGSASCVCRASMLWPCGVCADAHKPFLISVADKQTERVLREPTKLIFLKGETLWPPHSVLTRTAAAPSHEPSRRRRRGTEGLDPDTAQPRDPRRHRLVRAE